MVSLAGQQVELNAQTTHLPSTSIGNNREVMSSQTSTDPLLILSSALQTAFEAVAGRTGVDPVIRSSDRADAQANGALGLAKELGQNPRQVAEAVLAECAGLAGICSSVEVAGPGFLNLVFSNDFLSRLLNEVASDPRQCRQRSHQR